MKTSGFVGAAAAAALLGLLAPTVGSASEPAVHNGVGSMSAPASPSADRDTSAGHLITFDPGTSPCTFDFTSPLSEEYADQGVHFTGPGDDTGGAILNQCGGFGVDAHSGEEFLAFSTLSYAVPPEHIRFDDLQHKVKLWIADGFGGGTMTYKLKGLLSGEKVARKSITTTEAGWLKMKLSSESGLDEVVLKGTTPDGAFVVDDLKFRDL